MHYLPILMRSAYSVYPETTLAGVGKRAVYLLRHLWSLPYSRRWLQFLSSEGMVAIASENPSLYRKPIRPYVSLNWPRSVRVAAMIHHYEFLVRRMTAADFLQAVSPAGRVLLSFTAKNHDQLTIRLRYDGKFRKEGEATLGLESAKFRCQVSSLTFVVASSISGAPCIVIGAVYGLHPGADKNIIRETAKALSGLRPKALLLFLLQGMAQAWSVKALLGVGSRTHSSRHLVYALNKSRLFTITYDDFWRESGGSLRSDGLFALPLTAGVRDLQSVETHKRSLYRNRQALLAELQQRLIANLDNSKIDSAVYLGQLRFQKSVLAFLQHDTPL